MKLEDFLYGYPKRPNRKFQGGRIFASKWMAPTVFVLLAMPAVALGADGRMPTGTGPASLVKAGHMNFRSDLSDEFNGSRVDSSKWQTQMGSWTSAWSWSTNNVSERNGKLVLTMSRSNDGVSENYLSGIVRQRHAYEYGYVEARIKAAPRFPGVSSAFWAAPPSGPRETWTEIDFVETGQHMLNPRMIDTNTHVFRMPGIEHGRLPMHEHRKHAMYLDPRDGYHVYGCAWNAKLIAWYVDGRKIAEAPNTYWHQPLLITVSMGLRQPLKNFPSDQGFPTSMKVDYVRVWTAAEPK